MDQWDQPLETERSLVCTKCLLKRSEFFCTYCTQDNFLCELCSIEHTRKSIPVSHPLLPIKAHRLCNNHQDVERFVERTARKERGKEELQNNLELVVNCMHEVQDLASQVAAYVTVTIAQLEQVKAALEADIQEGIREVEVHLYEDSPELTSQIAKALWDYSPGCLKLFEYSLNNKDFSLCLGSILSFTYQPLSLPTQLVALEKHRMCLFQSEDNSWKSIPLTQPIPVDQGTMTLSIGQGKLFCCGSSDKPGNSYIGNLAFIIDRNGSATQLRTMITRRESAGVLYHDKTVYVFGGYNTQGYLKRSETYSLESFQWAPLPDMHESRCSFTPCISGELIYLMGGHTIKAEQFDLKTKEFTVLTPYLLPESTSCITVLNQQLIISDNFLTRWRSIDNRTTDTIRPPICAESNYPPLVLGTTLYTLYLACRPKDQFKGCRSFDLVTYAVQEFPLPSTD